MASTYNTYIMYDMCKLNMLANCNTLGVSRNKYVYETQVAMWENIYFGPDFYDVINYYDVIISIRRLRTTDPFCKYSII
jgi:hypothetical protein